ncbi:MAG: glycosyltransferase [Candidatus Auribacterota bacterium]|nr:glycosyltransferase [Candidatus Auribacterota bacterium]
MRVLQVGKFYYPYRGGMETYLRDLCLWLKDRVDLKVLVSNTSRRTVQDTVEGVNVIRAGRWGRVASTSLCPSFPRLLKQNAGDIISIQHPDPLAAVSYLLAHPHGKLVVVYQSDIIKQKLTKLLYHPFLFSFLARADTVIVTSPLYMADSPVLRRFREKCVVIPIGIDPDYYLLTPAIEEKVREIHRAHGNRIVLFVGRLALYKGIEYLLKAMEEVDGKLLVIGKGDRFRALAMMVASHHLEDKVFFMSEVSQSNLLAYLHACSVFCLPSISRNEAYGIVQLEAMACSRPVVSTRLDTGVNYINLDRETGLVVPPQDPGKLRDALNRLLDNPELSEKLGRQGRERVEQEFTKEKMAEKTYRLYQEIRESGYQVGQALP